MYFYVTATGSENTVGPKKKKIAQKVNNEYSKRKLIILIIKEDNTYLHLIHEMSFPCFPVPVSSQHSNIHLKPVDNLDSLTHQLFLMSSLCICCLFQYSPSTVDQSYTHTSNVYHCQSSSSLVH